MGVFSSRKKAEPLLRVCLYPKSFEVIPKHIAWGQKCEPFACKAYTEYMNDNSHSQLETSKCGFIVHPEKVWLGATPDTKVADPGFQPSHGLAEFKCLYIPRDI